MQAKHGKQSLGFSIIELMVVLIVVSILSAIAISFYKQYTIRAHREDVKSKMLQVAQNLQTYKVANGSYTGAAISNVRIFGGTQFPQTSTAFYTMGLTVANGGWVLTATPIATTAQNGNGQIGLNDEGQKCWTKAITSCTPSTSTTWDGK